MVVQSVRIAEASGSNKTFKYWAFISYSHRDKKLAFALHDWLEQYQVPTELVGQQSRAGHLLPDRLYPIFIDQKELPSSSGLTKSIRDALSTSRYLLVVCSPNVVESKWVNKEIDFYKSLGRGNSIHCAIVDGELRGSSPITSLFPKSLQLDDEPLAVDIRHIARDRKQELIRLVSGLLGIDFSTLENRERIRKRRRLIRNMALTIIGCIVLAGGVMYQSIERYRDLLTGAEVNASREDVIDFIAKVHKSPPFSIVQWQNKNFLKWGENLQHAPELDGVNYALDIQNQYVIVLGPNNNSAIVVYKLPSMHTILGETDLSEGYSFDLPGPVIRLTSGLYAVGLEKQASFAGGLEGAIAIVDVINKQIGIAWNELEEGERGKGFMLDEGCTRLTISNLVGEPSKELSLQFSSDQELEYIWKPHFSNRWVNFFDEPKEVAAACGENLLPIMQKD